MANEVVIKIRADGAAQTEGAIAKVNSALNTTGQHANHAAGGMQNLTQFLSPSRILAMAVAFQAMSVAMSGIQAIFIGMPAAIIDFSTQLQQARVAFNTMTGSAEVGAKTLADLQAFSLTTPFEFPDALEGAKRLMAMGTSAEDLIPTMAMLGDISAGVGREKLPQLILALGQVGAATKLRGTELRQFTEAGVPLLALLGEQLGKSAGEIMEMTEKGEIGFEAVRDALASTTSEGGIFFNLMETQSKTFGGAMSNVRDALRFATAEGFAPLFDALTQGANAFASFLQSQQAKQFAADVANAMTVVVGAIVGVITVGGNLFQLFTENEPLVKGVAITVGAMLAPALWSAATGFAAMVAPAIGVAAVLGTVAAAVAVVIDHWSLFEQAATIVRLAIGKVAESIGAVLKPAFVAMGAIIGKAVEFISDRVKTLAQLAVIAGHIAGQSTEEMQGLINFANGIGGGLDLSGIVTTFQNVQEDVGTAIGDMVSNARAGLDSLRAMIETTIQRVTQPINIPFGTTGEVNRKFTGPLPASTSGIEQDGKAVTKVIEAMLPVMEQLNRENAFKVWREEMKRLLSEGQLEFVISQFEALGKSANETAREILRMSQENQDAMDALAKKAVAEAERIVQGQADAIRASLAKGGTLEQGLAAFAKSEWIESLETEIKKALAAGLTPDPSLIQALKDGLAPMAEAVAEILDPLLGAEANKIRLTENWDAERQDAWERSMFGTTIRQAKQAADIFQRLDQEERDRRALRLQIQQREAQSQAAALVEAATKGIFDLGGGGFRWANLTQLSEMAARLGQTEFVSRRRGSEAGEAEIANVLRQVSGFETLMPRLLRSIAAGMAIEVDGEVLGRVTSRRTGGESIIYARVGGD